MHTGNGFSYRCFSSDPSGRHFILDAGPTSGAVNGWIDHGRLVRLKPAGDNVTFEVWERLRAPHHDAATPRRHDGAMDAPDPHASLTAAVPGGARPVSIHRPVMRQRGERRAVPPL